MVPIYEQGGGRGIGLMLPEFLTRFDKICEEHLTQGRARAFAFIFYDFLDQELRKILRDQGVFVQLDRLIGSKLSLFYLHAAERPAVDAFNKFFFNVLEIDGKATLPCVVFFRVKKDQIINVEIAQLDSADLIHGFTELHKVVERYIAEQKTSTGKMSAAIRIIKSSAKFLSLEIFRSALRNGLERIM